MYARTQSTALAHSETPMVWSLQVHGRAFPSPATSFVKRFHAFCLLTGRWQEAGFQYQGLIPVRVLWLQVQIKSNLRLESSMRSIRKEHEVWNAILSNVSQPGLPQPMHISELWVKMYSWRLSWISLPWALVMSVVVCMLIILIFTASPLLSVLSAVNLVFQVWDSLVPPLDQRCH